MVVAEPSEALVVINLLGSKFVSIPCPPNSLSFSKGAAQNFELSPTTTEPTGLTATIAPMITPFENSRDAEPSPPFRFAVVAPVPAP